jgi:N6-adenosine-specific RNA methylase IME4
MDKSPNHKQRTLLGKPAVAPRTAQKRQPPELYQVVIECRDENQQRELFERLRREGMKVRLLVL